MKNEKTKLYKFLNVPKRKSGIRDFLCSVLGDNPTIKFTHPLLLNDFNEFKARSSIPADDKFIKDKRDEILRQFTVLSLSKSIDVPNLWANYNNHEGICIEYDREKLESYLNSLRNGEIEYLFDDVTYNDEPPVLDFSKPDIIPQRIEWIKQMTFSKESCWSYEHEFRIVRYTTEKQKNLFIKISKDCITKIIIGTRASEYLVELIEKHYSFVPVEYEFPFYPTTYKSILTSDRNEARLFRQEWRIREEKLKNRL